MEYELKVWEVYQYAKTATIFFMVTVALDDARNVKATKAQCRKLFSGMSSEDDTNACYDEETKTLYIG